MQLQIDARAALAYTDDPESRPLSGGELMDKLWPITARTLLTTASSGSAAARRRRSPPNSARLCISSTKPPCARRPGLTGKHWPSSTPARPRPRMPRKPTFAPPSPSFSPRRPRPGCSLRRRALCRAPGRLPARAHPFPRQQQVARGADRGARRRHRPHRRRQLPRTRRCWQNWSPVTRSRITSARAHEPADLAPPLPRRGCAYPRPHPDRPP